MREPSLCEIVAACDDSTLSGMLELLPEDLELPRAPRDGVVLMTCREGLGDTFHLGEVLVTESLVRWRGVEGYAVVVGDDARRSLVAASMDAMRREGTAKERLAPLESLLARSLESLLARRGEDSRAAASTKVEFDLLPGA